MTDDLASRQAWVPLWRELADSSALLDRGDEMIETYKWSERDAPPIIAVLAMGSERLVKLSYGLATDDWHGVRARGHRLADLDDECRKIMRANAPTAYVHDLISGVDADGLLADLLRLLQVYADQGRFYNLDMLRGLAVASDSPEMLWRDLRASLSQTYRHLYGVHDVRTDHGVAVIEAAHNAALRRSLYRWRELYYRAWINGACGPLAKRFSGEINPDRNRPRP